MLDVANIEVIQAGDELNLLLERQMLEKSLGASFDIRWRRRGGEGWAIARRRTRTRRWGRDVTCASLQTSAVTTGRCMNCKRIYFSITSRADGVTRSASFLAGRQNTDTWLHSGRQFVRIFHSHQLLEKKARGRSRGHWGRSKLEVELGSELNNFGCTFAASGLRCSVPPSRRISQGIDRGPTNSPLSEGKVGTLEVFRAGRTLSSGIRLADILERRWNEDFQANRRPPPSSGSERTVCQKPISIPV